MSNFEVIALELRGYKKHKSLDIQFSEGVTVIRGANYEGKSSVTEAVFYALFGSSAVPGRKEDLVTRGTAPRNFSVLLWFMYKGLEGSVRRTLTTATAVYAGRTVATGHSPVSAWVEEMFGMSQKLVLLLSRSAQGETPLLMTLGAPELNRIIESVSDSKYVDNLIERSTEQAKIASIKLESVGEVPDIDSLTEMREELSLTIDVLGRTKGEQSKLVAFTQLAFEEANTKLKNAVANNTKVQENAKTLSVLNANIATASAVLEKLKETLGTLGELRVAKPLELEISKALKEFETLKQHEAVRAESLERLKREQKEVARLTVSDDVHDLQEAYEASSKVRQELLDKAVSAHATMKDWERQFKLAKQELESASCSSCKRPFNPETLAHAERCFNTLKERETVVKVSYVDSRSEYERQEKLCSSLEAKLPPVGWKEKLRAAEQEVQKVEALLETLPDFSSRQKDTQTKLDNLRFDLRTLTERNSRINDTTTMIANSEALIAKTKKMVSELPDLKEIELPPLWKARDEIAIELDKAKTLLADATYAVKDKTRELNALDVSIASAKVAKDLRDKLQLRQSRFSSFSSWLKKNKAAFLADIWSGLMAQCSEFTASCTDGKVSQVYRDDAGEFSYIEEGESFPLSCASGGQKSIMGVGLRLALASLLPQGCRLVTLDEPSGDLNDEHAAMLTSALKSEGRQVILVTHRDGDEVMADKVITLGEDS